MNNTQSLELLNPSTLTVDTNVRKDAALTPSFISSIRELGVLEPVVAHRKDDGTVHVLMGQRRTLGAIEAGRSTIPVMVITSPDEAERIVTQVVENIQRTELGQEDEANAYHQLSLIGVSAAAIAKQTGREKTSVEKALKAKSTEAGSNALAAGRTIDQALALAEFEGDTDSTEELESVLADEPHYFDHILQKLRDKRESDREFAELVAKLESEGKAIVQDYGNYEDSENISVSALNRSDGEQATDVDSNAVHVKRGYQGEVIVIHIVTGWKELGFTPRWTRYDSGPTKTGPMNDEQKEERRTLIANNKAMESAGTVRRAWVKTLLSRKTAPKGWQYFTVHSMTRHYDIGRAYSESVAAEMIGVDSEGWSPLKDHVANTQSRPEFALIALILASFEKQIQKDSWRSPQEFHKDYLNQLVVWGYVDRTKWVSLGLPTDHWSHRHGHRPAGFCQ